VPPGWRLLRGSRLRSRTGFSITHRIAPPRFPSSDIFEKPDIVNPQKVLLDSPKPVLHPAIIDAGSHSRLLTQVDQDIHGSYHLVGLRVDIQAYQFVILPLRQSINEISPPRCVIPIEEITIPELRE
jgi:hypothetical protein